MKLSKWFPLPTQGKHGCLLLGRLHDCRDAKGYLKGPGSVTQFSWAKASAASVAPILGTVKEGAALYSIGNVCPRAVQIA